MNRRFFLQKVGLGITAVATFPVFHGCENAAANSPDKSFKKANRRPNILWIMLDDGRADALGCYGKPWAKTPNMDTLAAKGVRFETAIIQNPVCVPSRRSMITGFYSHQIGPVAMGKEPQTPGGYIDNALMRKLDTRPNLLDAWTLLGSKPVNVGKIHGFERSWDNRGDAPSLLNSGGKPTSYFIEKFGANSSILNEPVVRTKIHHWQIGGVLPVRPEDTETWRLGDMAIRTLGELAEKKEPFFLRVSFHAPHVACHVPKEYFIDPKTIDLPLPTTKELKSKPKFEKGPLRTYAGGLDLTKEQIDLCRGTYYGMVQLVDVQVGRIMEILKNKGILDNTLIAINSDQGFQLGEHGLWKKRVFYDPNVKSPLILHCPALLPEGKVIDEPIEMVDFLPTLMELSGMDVPDDIRGKSLTPLIQGKVKQWRPACFCEIDHSQSLYDELRGGGRRVMVRTKQWKLIFFMDERIADKDGALYNLKKDPDERYNLYTDSKYSTVVQKLEALAQQWNRGEI